jgi:hypothetical protein
MQTVRAPSTLGEFNALLSKAGISQINGDQFTRLKAIRNKNHLISAVTRMADDQGALVFIRSAVQEALGVVANDAQNGAPSGRQAQGDSQQRAQVAQAQAQRQSAQQSRRDDPTENFDTRRQREDSHSGERHSFHVYGGKGALCFETDMTRGNLHTISLDAATATGPREYDWKSKIRIQLTRQELPVVAAVLFGFLPRCEFKNHGPEKDKGFSIEDQKNKLFVRVFSKEGARAVPVEPVDAYRIATLFIRQLRKDSPWMTSGDIINTLRAVVANRMAS